MNKQEISLEEKITQILRRNEMFDKYDDSEEGSFSEGEKVLSLCALQQKQYHTEVDYNCPCFTDGFRTADAENGFNAKQMVRESLAALREKIEGIKYSNTGARLYTQYNQAIDDVLSLLQNKEGA